MVAMIASSSLVIKPLRSRERPAKSEFLGTWERLNNPGFKPVEFDGFRKLAGLNSLTLTPERFFGGMSIEETAEFPASLNSNGNERLGRSRDRASLHSEFA